MRRGISALAMPGLVACLVACGGATEPIAPAPRGPATPKARSADASPGTACSRAEASAPTLGAVSLRGSTIAEPCKILQSRAGAPLVEASVEADIRALYATGLFADVTAVVEESDSAPPALVFELRDRPRLADVAVRGAPPGFEAPPTLGDVPGRYDPVWVRTVDARLQDALQEAGYRKAVVSHDVTPAGEDAVVARFSIEPGSRFVLGAARFEGLITVSAELLRKDLALTPDAPAYDDMIARDRLVVGLALYEVGLVESDVKARVVENFLASKIDVVFTVSEGPPYRLGAVKVSGEGKLPAGRYAASLATLPRGTLFARSKVAAAVQSIERLHHDAGKDRRIEVSTQLDQKKRTIDVDLHLD